uniref:Uncharacterized protein n=1 Tax=Schistosoma haematobium TaxID=6185 RepID=A0A095A685_SCHHA
MFDLIDKPDSVIGMYNDEIPKLTKPLGYDRENLWWGHMKVTQFAVARPLFQGAYISSSVKSEFPDLAKLLQNQKVLTVTLSRVIEMQTAKSSFQLNHFSKSSDFGKG